MSIALPPMGHQWASTVSPVPNLCAWVCSKCGSFCFEEPKDAVRFECAKTAVATYPLDPYRKEAGDGEDWYGYGDPGGPVMAEPPSCAELVANSSGD